ncbi:hypothetical protein [Mycobacteroides abscessus]|uniref:hypothetical protein n=1 Tax=Mycobacteroides abscessus TaxID=36809 RepID=UPI000C258216|nr:hypothetical protein [Mycobacteroides abscessus]
MTTRALLVRENREIDLAKLSSDDYQSVIALQGQIRRDDEPQLLCLGARPEEASLYVKRSSKGNYFASHFSGHAHGPHRIATMSDEHRRQTDYFVRAAESAGYAVTRELSTGNGTRLDAAITATVNIGVEVQRSALHLAAAKSRTRRSANAGWHPLWFTTAERRPQWWGHISSLSTTLRIDYWAQALPKPHEATALGISTLVFERCDINAFDHCPVSGKGFCGRWHYKFVPRRGLSVDDVTQLMPAGEIVPIQPYRTDYTRLISREDKYRIEQHDGSGTVDFKPEALPLQVAQATSRGCAQHPHFGCAQCGTVFPAVTAEGRDGWCTTCKSWFTTTLLMPKI